MRVLVCGKHCGVEEMLVSVRNGVRAGWLVRALCVLLNVCSGRSNALETGARAWKAGGKGDTQ